MSDGGRGGRSGRTRRKPPERGCLIALLLGWVAWIAIDLARLGVFGGRRSFGEALFDMPSVLVPLFLGVGIVPMAVRGFFLARRKKAFPDEPWMWEQAWSRTGARPMEPSRLPPLLVFAVLATTIAGMLAFVARYVVESDLLLAALTPFYATAVGLWAWWGYRLARVLRARGPFFRYGTFPFFLGERVQGDLEGVAGIAGFTQATLTLRCVRERMTGSGRGRRVSRETVHEQVREIGPAGVAQRLVAPGAEDQPVTATLPVIPVRFELPEGDMGTRFFADPARKWELHARAAVPGLDLEATFLLPVYPPPRKAASTEPGGRAG